MSHIESMEKMIECLVEKSKAQLDNGVESVDTHEMGEVIDMIKDLAEAKYKCTVTKAMKDADEDDELRDKIMELTTDDAGIRFYNRSRYSDGRYAPSGYGRRNYEPMYYERPTDAMREYDRQGKMYYGGNPTSNNSPAMMPYNTESKYDRARRGYTDSKDMHKANTAEDKQAKMKDLENYAKELTEDVTDMINGASPEEKTLLRNKLNLLVQKI